MSADEPRDDRYDDEEPDPRLLWRWVGAAIRPYAGWILIGAGALVMLLGYLGVSREAIPAKQIPYLVSGGIGGVFLAVIGAYFLGTQEIRNDSGRLDRLERMVEDLHDVLLRRPDAPVVGINGNGAETADDAASNGAAAPARRVLVVADGELFHRASCALVEGKEAEELTPATARRRGLRPCPACAPVRAAAAS
ncbi:MAG: hypothetical protein ACT4OV_01860 [Microthrixaceae bacterium]